MKTIVFGDGGYASTLVDMSQESSCPVHPDYYFVDEKYKTEDYIYGVPVITSLKGMEGSWYFSATYNHSVRKKWMEMAKEYNMKHLPAVIHRNTYISKRATLPKHCCIGPFNIIEQGVTLGEFSHLSYQSKIGHGSTVGNFAHVMPNCMIGGNNKIGESLFMATAVNTMEKISIGDNVTINIGCMITKNLESNITYLEKRKRCIIKKKQKNISQ